MADTPTMTPRETMSPIPTCAQLAEWDFSAVDVQAQRGKYDAKLLIQANYLRRLIAIARLFLPPTATGEAQAPDTRAAIPWQEQAARWHEGEQPTQVSVLADAVWRVLDDMGEFGLSTCLATKASLRVAFEPFREQATEGDKDADPEMTLAVARAALIASTKPKDQPVSDAPDVRASLRSVTDTLALLLDAGKFPPKGRSQDDKNSAEGWWEDCASAVRHAYAALAGVSVGEWQSAHPGLYIPPHGPVVLSDSTESEGSSGG